MSAQESAIRPEPARSRRRPPEALTPAEVRALLGACGRGPAGMRNKALLVVLWRAGLRCAEALDLRIADVDLKAGAIRVRHGKGDRSRTVGIDPEAVAVIDGWVKARSQLPYPRANPLFCTISAPHPGQALDGSYVRTMLRRLGRQAGVERRVHPHAFRHTYAVECAREGIAPELLRRQLGHASLHTTTVYLQGIAAADVIETMHRRSWPETTA